MKVDRFVRLALALLILAVFLIATGGLLFVTDSALSVWDRLSQGPAVLLYAYVGAMTAIVLGALLLIWRLLVRRKPRVAPQAKPAPLTQAEIEERLSDADAAGIDTEAAREELQQLAGRQQSGYVHLCFFGEVSVGKSSLIKALVPDANVSVDVVAGSTADIRHYRWQAGDAEVLLTDVPGTGGHDIGFDTQAMEEARRSHVVLFVCDSDLTRQEQMAVKHLLALKKPTVLVMNKADRFNTEEQAVVMHRLLERLEEIGGKVSRDRVVAVSAGGEVDVVTTADDGSETTKQRSRPADVGVLVVAINRLLGEYRETLDAARDRAVFELAADKLAAAEAAYRKQRAEQVIRSSTRKAMIGSMAAISPGTDVIVQGYIGTTMTQELCKLYGAAPRDLDIEEFLTLSQSRVGRALPLTLAVAGNGLKAFPGVGTVAGGAVHAVAYGLIFDALGRSLVLTLAKHGELDPERAAEEFEEGISEHIETGVRRIAKMALEEKVSGK